MYMYQTNLPWSADTWGGSRAVIFGETTKLQAVMAGKCALRRMIGGALTCCFLSLRLEPGRSELQMRHSQSDMKMELGSEKQSRHRGEDAQQRHPMCRWNDVRVLRSDRCNRVPKAVSNARSECAAGVLVLC